MVATDPAPGETVNVGDTVVLDVSKGPVKVEDVVGMNIADAQKIIKDKGFEPVLQADDTRSDVPYGQVFEQFPAAGVTWNQTAQVQLRYSTYVGPPTANDDTATTLAGEGLNVRVLDNDTTAKEDVDLDKATLTLLDSAGNPTAVIQTPGEGAWLVKPNGTIRFNPADGFVGTTTSVTYQIADSNGKTDTATVTVTVA